MIRRAQRLRPRACPGGPHWRFAGAHPVLSLVSFNLGIALGEVIALALVFVVLGVLFTHVLGTRAGMIVLCSFSAMWAGIG